MTAGGAGVTALANRDRDRPYWRHSDPEAPSVPPHPCLRGAYCAGSTVTLIDGEKVTTPASATEVYCRKCRDQTERKLRELPELWVRLHMELGNKGQATERVTMSRSAPLPLRADVDELLREHLYVLASWDERVRTAGRLVLPDTQEQRARTDHGVMLAEFVKTLAEHLGMLLALPADAMCRVYNLTDLGRIPEGCYGRTNRIGGYAEVTEDLSGADAGEEIHRLNYRTKARIGETGMRDRLDVPCPSETCDLLMLERVQGSEYSAECRACGRLLSEQEYLAWTRLYIATVSHKDLPQRKLAALAGQA